MASIRTLVLTVTIMLESTVASLPAFVCPMAGKTIPSVKRFTVTAPFVFGEKPLTVLNSSSNGPLSDDNMDDNTEIDMKELQQRIDKQTNQYIDLLSSDDEEGPRPEVVNIIVFNPESENEQGVHTVEFPKGSGNNIILAFESGEECVRFAQMLKNMQFYEPVPQETDLDQLETFCEALGVPVKVVPKGKDLRPPSDNVDELSHNPNLGKEKSKLENLFEINDTEADGQGSWE